MNKINDFRHQDDSSFVGWVFSGNIIKKSFNFNIYAILLQSMEKILIIELRRQKNNAVILNADGTEHRRIINPESEAICFGDAYYIKNELTLINRKRDATMSGVVIDEDGNIIRIYEKR